MTCCLAQAQQGFEHLEFGLLQSVALDVLEQLGAIIIAQLVVKLALAGFEITVKRLLGLGRQLFGHLPFGAAQNKRPERLR